MAGHGPAMLSSARPRLRCFMRRFRIFAWAVILAAACAVPALHAGISPVNLLCDGWPAPLGVDNFSPRLTWQLTAPAGARAQSQSAYEVQVASSPARLASNQPDLWDSGKASGAAGHAVYAGATLTSAQQVFWQVRVWDGAGQVSSWSPTATWTMGLLNQTNWLGAWLTAPPDLALPSLSDCSWIWYPEGAPTQSAPVGTRYFRKTFYLGSSPAVTSATLLVTADNSYTAYLNGVLVGSGQNYALAIPADVTGQVLAGTNVLAIAAANAGSASNPAGLIGKLVLKFADGTQTSIPMDATWKSANALYNNWQLVNYADRSWTNALVLGAYGTSPWGTGVVVQSATNGLPVFRRQFTVNPGLQRAVIYICGLGQYELSANGAKVGTGLLAPGWTKYDQTCLYDTLDLTASLTNGNNVVGVMLGNGMYNVAATANYTKFTGSFGPLRLIAQIHLYYTNGTSQTIPSDKQWVTTSGPITYSHVYGGEAWDARKLASNWNQAGFDAATWSAAMATNGPGGTLRGQSHAAPPIIATQTLSPIHTTVISSSTVVYDLGQNAAVIPTLTAHGPAGAVVQITPAELTNADGTVNRTSAGGGTAYWQYTLAGTGTETWTPKFYYHGCRYLQVTLTAPPGSSALPTVDSLTGAAIQTAATNVGSFSCSSDLFNRTRNIIQWSQRNNLISILTDCPHRERLGWLEQDNLNGPSLRYEFDLGRLFTKAMQDMADSQTSAGTGLVPDIAPEYTTFGGGFRDSPEWGSSVILVPWQQYQFTGDDTLLRNYYSAMTNYFSYLRNQSSGNFLNYPNGLGDWYDIGPNAPGFPQNTPVSLTADAYYCQDAQILGQVAAVIGRTNDAAQFNLLATNIGNAFNATYFSAANGYYATGSQTAQALPLYLGLVNPTNQAAVLAGLVANIYSKGLTAGEIGHRYLLRALTDMGRADVVQYLHGKTNATGYGYILSQGDTAMTEAWDANPDDSQDHFMLGHIIEWFYHDLAGIQMDPAAPGFQNVIIKPAFVNGMTWVNANFNSVAGLVASSWSLTNNQATLNVTVPAGSTGSIYVPILGAVTTNLVIKESGTIIWQNSAPNGNATGVTFSRIQTSNAQTFVVWNVGSGAFQFTWNVLAAPGGLSASASNGQATLSWNASPNATGYNVKRSAASGGPYVTVGSGVTATNYVDLVLSNNLTYYYVISAINGGNESANSWEISVTPGFVANFGFETPAISAYQYNPTGGAWTFTPLSGTSGSGITANGSGFTSGNTNTPQGSQVGFLQGTGSISQAVSGLIAGATYQITFAAAQRNNIYGAQTGQSWDVRLGGTVLASYSPPESAQNYVDYSASFTAPVTGSSLLTFAGTDKNGGDNTIFIDNVRLALAPSLVPPHLACQVAGGRVLVGWPPDHAGWRLQQQTDALSQGLGTNWITVNGSTLTNQLALAMAQSGGCAFFRLVYP